MEKIAIGVMAVVFVVIVFGGWSALQNDKEREMIYKKTCIEAEGTPVSNGRNWECIKK